MVDKNPSKILTCKCLFAVDEMYLASLINKGREAYIKGTTNPTALPAEVVLKMATINGAKSVLLDNEIGSIEIGKKVRQHHAPAPFPLDF